MITAVQWGASGNGFPFLNLAVAARMSATCLRHGRHFLSDKSAIFLLASASPVLVDNNNLHPAVLLAPCLSVVGRYWILFTKAMSSDPIRINPILD